MQPHPHHSTIRLAALLALPLSVAVSTTASAQVRLTPDDLRAGDQFGFSGQIDSGLAIVGSFRSDDVDLSTNSQSGSAYIFMKDSLGNWSQQAKLVAADAQAGDQFGYSTSLSGNTALIGAFRSDDVGSESGSAYVFTGDGLGNWNQQAKLTANDAASGDQFGFSVSLSGDTAAVGAFRRDDVDPSWNSQSGAAYVFTRDVTGNWSQQARLNASNALDGDFFGYSVGVDGDTLVAGAVRADVVGVGIDAGAAYVYERDGSDWTEAAILQPSDLEAGDLFGQSVAVDSDRVLVGALREDGTSTSSTYNTGAAYIFERSSDEWVESAKLLPSDQEDELSFGYSVALSGNYAMVGANFQNTSSAGIGRAYLFELSEEGSWSEILKIEASDVDSTLDLGDQLGTFVSVDGIDTLVGAFRLSRSGTSTEEGAAYVVAIPEPTVVSLMAVSSLALLRRRRAAR